MIGSMRHRITIEQPSRTADTYGGQAETWTAFDTLYARIEPVSAAERFFAHRLEENVTHKITVRRNKNKVITGKMRVSFDSRYFQIKGVRNLDEERNTFVELSCVEGIGA